MAEPELTDMEQAIALMRQAALNERWNALTPFEQEVGLALNDHLIHGSSTADCPISAHWLKFAPRIAAAIVAANAAADSEALDSREQSQQAALAALRAGDV